MRKSIYILLLFILLIFFPLKSNAQTVEYKDWRTRKTYSYSVSTFDELYSVFEDLNCDYEKCQEELNGEINLQDEHIKELQQEINELEYELSNYRNKEHNNKYWLLIFIPFIIFSIPFLKGLKIIKKQ